MSYSRWGNSPWYTFWCASQDTTTKNGQVFSVCSVMEFTYLELKTDMEGCLQRMEDYMAECVKENERLAAIPEDEQEKDMFGMARIAFGGWKATDEELTELRGYMREFIQDVEDDKDLI